jgi:hypothetical protein
MVEPGGGKTLFDKEFECRRGEFGGAGVLATATRRALGWRKV